MANTILHSTASEWPGETMRIKTLATVDLSGLKSVTLLGTRKKLKWRQTAEGLEITMPDKPEYDYAYPVKLVFEGKIPHFLNESPMNLMLGKNRFSHKNISK